MGAGADLEGGVGEIKESGGQSPPEAEAFFQESGFSPRRGDCCTDSCETWQSRRAHGSAWLCKITPQLAQGVGVRHQNMKNFYFWWYRVASQGRILSPISRIFMDFYMLNYPALVFQI